MEAKHSGGKFNFAARFVSIFGTSLLLLAGACSSGQTGELKLVSLDEKHDYSQSFSEAYICKNNAGDLDIMLTQDASSNDRHENPSKPLTPEASVQPRQFVHLRVFWKPLGSKADHPASTNASVQWCLVGDGANVGSVLEYGGSGLVMVTDARGGSDIVIRTAWLKSVQQRGDMVDPLGPSRLQGTVHAVADADRVNALLAEMKSAAAGPEVQANRPTQPERMTDLP